MTVAQNDSDSDPPSAVTEAVEQLAYEWTYEQQRQHLGAAAQNTQICCLGAPCTAQPVSASGDEPHTLTMQGYQSLPTIKHC